MIATGKHFPGHGDTGTNSHLALPVVRVSRARLDSVELVPFNAAVKAGVGAIMTFHGSMPALDSSGAPGTLSHNVLTSLLRDEMHFRGLVVSDAMDMRAVLDAYGAVNASQMAVAAGADVLLQPQDVAQTIDAVVAGVAAGKYPEARLDASVRRILAAKARVGLRTERLVDLDRAREIVGDSADAAIARAAADRSITLVRDSAHQLPLARLNKSARILSITYAHRADLGAGVTFDAELRRVFPALRPEYVDADNERPDFFHLFAIADSADVILVSSYVAHSSTATTVDVPRSFVDFIEELNKRKEHPVVIAFGNPYFLQQIPDVGAYVVAWGGFPVSQGAAARALLDRFGYKDRDGDGYRETPDGKPLLITKANTPAAIDRVDNELWKKCMDAIGIRMVFFTQKWPELNKMSEAGQLQMWGLSWLSNSPDGDAFASPLYSKNIGTSNDARFRLPAYDRAYEASLNLPDGPARTALYRSMSEAVLNYAPWMIDLNAYASVLAQPWLKGYKQNPFLRNQWKYYDVDRRR